MKRARLEGAYLVVVGLGVLHRLQVDGHDGERRGGQVFDHRHQLTPQRQRLHLTPADRLAVELCRGRRAEEREEEEEREGGRRERRREMEEGENEKEEEEREG